MDLQKPLYLFLLLLTLLSSSQAKKFNVGGSQGWVPNPSESYNNWAGRNRFQINDTIVFNYKKGSDSVLEVKKEDYDKCNKTNPIKKFENGDTEFKFDRSGPFYFISGNDGNCEKGQKLIVVVLSPRKSPSPSPSPSLSPLLPPKDMPSPSPKPNPPIVSPSSPPSPAVQPPSNSISPKPANGPSAAAPGPENWYPATAPAPETMYPVTSPPAPPPETGTPPPFPAEPISPPQSSAGPTSPPQLPAGPTSPPQSETAPSPTNGGFAKAPSNALVYFVTIVVGGVMLHY
ncbi:hypothetical protein LR48_Vigan08g015900 [Vigna angularis]|uniref:Early nodulin-like protein n=2 Tax=Phaseolus angularis TaxID=3914 RepID=A0A0L9V336_PHAAN|nr:early nodulin-like protein 2 [Vigna angularis]KAG2396728.1 Early nodulin-like protein [Vigna angularis]KOM49332.1 hypothetical protein LR48_Vigan08g015900 [Vigna angularis]BAT89540.1 hypothetical protein VIGAN_06051600 [Vigna angularis var. angularis]